VRTLAAALALLALALLVPASASAREQSRKCYPKYDKGIAASTRVRVFYGQTEDGDYWYKACDLLTGRRTVLAEGTFRDGDSVGDFSFAGRVVAFRHGACSYMLTMTCQGTRVRTLDVQTRRGTSARVDGTASDVIALPNRGAVWIEASAVRHLAHNRTVTQLDSGPGLEPGSLALAPDSHVYWRKAGVPRSAQLPEQPQLPEVPEPKRSRACFPKGSVTELATTRVRVFAQDDEGVRTGAVVACDLRTGRRVELASFDLDGQSYQIGHLRAAGTAVAMGAYDCFKEGCSSSIVVADVAGGAARSVATLGGRALFFDLVLKANGSLAYTWGPLPSSSAPARVTELRSCDAGGCTTVDGSGEVAPRSLALSPGSQLYWTRAGEPRTAVLD
jgi:hypothetical protein